MLFKSLYQILNSPKLNKNSISNNNNSFNNSESLNSVQAADHRYNNIFTRPQMYTF
ncbi:hypothetical protein DDB_G0271318 [Dictyostelium discoideum AX4]|uniref:Uncharacterized protein n=1 Tax=Dictyostelium discoideum TaxID=44689 RepID=Q55BG0_DICDI|nr:hypothetical protein DDB_G0271318 [Dictyostelium discoideum AX4]EAL71789.1 hypothetical protein DDB_G0271318 [Dictyostelium discoideum AX4]|eukprot:XP_645652.1 hypothetical protein DDB_G0271318 [Dictyostelium discoideum AX4]